jgi:spermidine synthase
VEVRRQPLIYLLFFCSGLSGLIYQVVWVRVFGNVFGNTVYSAALVVAVFMLGLGAGSYVVGGWADRRHAVRPGSLPAAYGVLELAIGVIGLAISAVLPRLVDLSARVSSYARAPNGWYVLSTSSYLARIAIAIALLTPITLLMGGTLTLLIRHFVTEDLDAGSRRIAVLYAVNTAGAALGCFLTDFLLVPALGLLGTQFVAVSFNLIAGAGAFMVARNPASGRRVRLRPDIEDQPSALSPRPSLGLTSLALALSGFAAMGMEILWFRHVSILLGGFRAVFSLLMTVILAGIGGGALAAGLLRRRVARPAVWLMVVQGLFVALSLSGLAAADARAIERAVTVDRAFHLASELESSSTRTLQELWFNTRPILMEVGLPALLMGFSFPLANALTQRADRAVGRRAGVLYLSNTCGAVCGSLAAGFVLLPALGIQGSATVLATAAAIAMMPLYFATWQGRGLAGLTVAALTGGVAVGAWLLLPSDYVIARAAPALDNERLIARSEGVTEVVAVTETPTQGRTLLTNGHPMSSTSRQSQRYMRALAHVPLLSIDRPEAVLVIGFGVGNTAHAATLHPSIRRVEVADLSRGILEHAGLFDEFNRDVLSDPRVAVYVNDGRHHLQMQPSASYDLITLEPPPIGYAGVAALYSTEFYALARSRLKAGGYLSQWLPAYQVPAPVTLAMVRAFVDVFPQTVLISGAEADLLLLGANDARIEIDPARVAGLLVKAPGVRADLQRLDLGTPREIVGAFVGSAATLTQATRDVTPVSDDRPIQEYGVRSLLDFGEAVPASIVDLRQVTAWCPTCFIGGKPAPGVEGLDTYLALTDRAYRAPPLEVARARSLAEQHGRVVAGSAYLGALVPESADVHNILGIALADRGRIDEAIAEFREALRLDPASAQTHWHLGAALAYRGARDEAVEHLRESVRLDPGNANARHDLDVLLTLDPRR